SEEQVERVDAEQLDAAANEHAAQHCSDDLPGCPAAYDEFGGRHPDAYPETSDGGEKCGKGDQHEQKGCGTDLLMDGRVGEAESVEQTTHQPCHRASQHAGERRRHRRRKCRADLRCSNGWSNHVTALCGLWNISNFLYLGNRGSRIREIGMDVSATD